MAVRILSLVSAILFASVSAQAASRDLYIDADFTKPDQRIQSFNLYAAFEDRHAEGIDILLPPNSEIEGVDILTESSYYPAICSVTGMKKLRLPNGKPALVIRVKALEIDVDDGNCQITVKVRNGKSARVRIELTGT